MIPKIGSKYCAEIFAAYLKYYFKAVPVSAKVKMKDKAIDPFCVTKIHSEVTYALIMKNQPLPGPKVVNEAQALIQTPKYLSVMDI